MEMTLRKDQAGRVRFSDEMIGFHVIGGGDEIGKIDHACFDGLWATVAVGRLNKTRYAIPHWAVSVVDPESESVLIGYAKEDVIESPEYDAGVGMAGEYREEVGAYYRDVHGGAKTLKIA
jgi:hypothetical protein